MNNSLMSLPIICCLWCLDPRANFPALFVLPKRHERGGCPPVTIALSVNVKDLGSLLFVLKMPSWLIYPDCGHTAVKVLLPFQTRFETYVAFSFPVSLSSFALEANSCSAHASR